MIHRPKRNKTPPPELEHLSRLKSTTFRPLIGAPTPSATCPNFPVFHTQGHYHPPPIFRGSILSRTCPSADSCDVARPTYRLIDSGNMPPAKLLFKRKNATGPVSLTSGQIFVKIACCSSFCSCWIRHSCRPLAALSAMVRSNVNACGTA